MEGGRFERIDALFHSALEVPAAGRREWIERECTDPDIRREVLEMLDSRQEACSWFDRFERDLGALAPSPPPLAGADRSGQRIGPYEILREIGHGGMGVVYLARRADGEFEKQVALKLIRRGRESEEILQRFLAERRILSRLEHPGIARLIDAGTADDGTPYYVMEYVDGVPLGVYCEKNRLGIARRLDLVRQIGEAVQYAHRNLVVHRDLKPGNILVTADRQVKLLDFGIAKVLQDGPDGGESTQSGLHPLTPEFAAPELLLGEAVTTLTDVYALGVILYQLLCGRRPFSAQGSSLAELQREVLSGDPAPPSHWIADARDRRAVEGDLDRICLAALRREPAERYLSVAEMMEDIRRHQVGLPVAARGRSLAYRAGKFIRRNRFGVAMGAAVVLLTVAFTASFAAQTRRAERERDRAQRVTELFGDLFSVVDPDTASGSSVTAREILDLGADRIRSMRSDAQDDTKAALLDLMGTVYHKLGLYDRAKLMLEESLALRRASGRGDSEETAVTLQRLGLVLHDKGDYSRAEQTLRGAVESLASRKGYRDPATAHSMTFLGMALYRQGQIDASEPYFRQAVDTFRSVGGQPGPFADSLTGLGLFLYAKGRYAEAEPVFREALGLRRAAYVNRHRLVAESLNNLGTAVSRLGRDGESETLQREALDTLRSVFGPKHPRVGVALNNLALIRMSRGDDQAAEPLLRESLEIRRATLPAAHPDLAQVLGNLGLLLKNRGLLAEAEAMTAEALDIRRRAFGAEHPSIVQSLSTLGQIKQAQGRYAEAEDLLRQAASMSERLLGAGHPATAGALQNMAEFLEARRRPEAGAYYRRVLEQRRRILPAGHPHLAYTLVGLGRVLASAGQCGEAAPLLEEAVSIRDRTLPAGHPLRMEAAQAAAICSRFASKAK